MGHIEYIVLPLEYVPSPSVRNANDMGSPSLCTCVGVYMMIIIIIIIINGPFSVYLEIHAGD